MEQLLFPEEDTKLDLHQAINKRCYFYPSQPTRHLIALNPSACNNDDNNFNYTSNNRHQCFTNCLGGGGANCNKGTL